MPRRHDPTKRLIKRDPKNGRYYGDLRYYDGSRREALKAPGCEHSTRDAEEAARAWDKRVEELKRLKEASRGALGARGAATKAAALKVDLFLPVVYAGYHIKHKRQSGEVRDMKQYEHRLNYVISLPPIARLKRISQIDRRVITELIDALRASTITTVRSKRTGQPWSARTIRNYLSPLSDMLERAVEEGVLERNPLHRHRDMPKLGDETPREALEYHEAVQLMEVWDRHPHLITSNFPYGKLVSGLMMLAGLRRGEALGVEVRDIDLVRKRLAVRRHAWRDVDGAVVQRMTKNSGSERYVRICAQLIAVIEEHLRVYRPTGRLLMPKWVGIGESRREARYKNCDSTLAAAYKAAGIAKGSTSYTLRHTFISHSLNVVDRDGVYQNPKYVAAEAGHANTAMVETRYGHILAYPVKIEGELRFVRELIPAVVATR